MPLADEIRQTRPFASKRQEAVLALLKTVDVLRAQVADVLEPWGVTPQQYNVLRILRGAGKDGLPTLEIAGRMIEHAPGITRLLDRLEAKGLVARRHCPADRRRVLCALAPAGARLLSRMDGPIRRADDVLAALGDSEVSSLIRILDKVRAPRAASATSRKE